MSNAPPLPTDAELDILAVLWRLQPCSAREVHEALATQTGYTTTLKQMQLMTGKGLVRRNERFRTHVYEACVPQEQTQAQIAGDLIRRAFGGSAKNLVIGALSAQPASRADLEEIRRMIGAAEKEGCVMGRITLILSQPILSQLWVRDLGWTFIQFLWQGTLLAVAFAIARRFVSTQGRYRLSVGTLIAMTAAPVLTFTAGSSVAAKIPWPISPGIPWEQLLTILAILWAAGTLIFSIRLAYGWRATSLLRKIGVNDAPEDWKLRFQKLAERMGVAPRVQLLLSSVVNAPATIGWLRPLVFLPASLLTGLPPSQIEALLAHELAHVKRMDYAVNILQSVAEAILFYHPAVWWVSNQIRAEREFICDDLAAAVCGNTLEYARALAELESARITSFALAASDGSLVARIRRLLAPETAISTAPVASTIIVISILWIAGAGSVIAQTQEPPPPAANVQIAQNIPVPATALLFNPFGPAPQAPAPTSTAPEEKTSTVTGKVITGKDEGVPRAEVTLLVPGRTIPGSIVGFSTPRTIFTDAGGSFVFENVPPGDRTISAGKTGFLPLTSANPNLFVEPNRNPPPVVLRLTPQGVISGTVIDSFGEPVSHSYIEVYRLAYTGGRKQKVLMGRTIADDQGRFRVPVLPAGRYYVLASPPPRTNWDAASLTQPTLAPSYYPGVTSLETAALVDVSAGSTSAIAIRMNNDRLHSIRGQITYDGPSVPQMYVQVVPVEERPYTPMNSTGPFGSRRAFPDGKFEIADLPPGRYVLDARVCLGEKGTQCYDGNTGVPMTQGTAEVTIRNSDLEDVVIAVTTRFPVTGKIRLENGDFKSLTPPSASGIVLFRPGIGLEPIDSTEPPFFAIPAEDGSFQLLVAKPGLYRAAFTMVPSTVYGKSIRIDGQDALAKPVYISSGSRIEALLSDHPASVSGVVRDAQGDALPGVTVTIWAADPAILLSNRAFVTDRNGAFTFAGLGPGDYRVAAWENESLNSGILLAPEFLAQFAAAAEKVSLDAGASATTAPKLIPAADVAAAIAKLP